MTASETIFLVEQKKEEAHAHAQSHIIIILLLDITKVISLYNYIFVPEY